MPCVRNANITKEKITMDRAMPTLSPYASAEYWSEFMKRHDMRRAFSWATDGLAGVAVLDIEDDRSVDEIGSMFLSRGLDAVIETVEYVIVAQPAVEGSVKSRMIDLDLDDYERSNQLYSPTAFLKLLRDIRNAPDPDRAARAAYARGFHPCDE